MTWGKARAARPDGAAEGAASEVDFWRNFASSASPELVLRPDSPTFSVAFVNDACLSALCIPRQRTVGQPVSLVSPMEAESPSEGVESLAGSLTQVLSSGVGNAMQVRRYERPTREHAAGGFDELFFTAQNTPLTSTDGQLSYLVHRLVDVTAVVRWAGSGGPLLELERLLRARTASLATADRELAALSYSVSHDLRAPLRAIDGFSQALSSDCAELLDERARHYLERVRAGAQRMSQMLDDLLALSRIHQAPVRHSLVDLSELGRKIIAGLTAREPQRQVLVHIAGGMLARGDAQLLGVVLEQLLGNAWKFTEKVRSAEIHFSEERIDGQSRFCIEDNGVGFDMAYENRLFTPFQRLHRAGEFDGTGIGLCMVHRIIARHGGWISMQAEVGKGTKAWFTFDEGGSRA